MNARRNQEQIGLFPVSNPAPTAREIEAIRLAALRARDAQLAAMLRRLAQGIGHAFAAIGQALVTWPERRRTYEELRALTDRELADIGMTRGDIARVFDPEFQLPARREAANAGKRPVRAAMPSAA